MRHWLLIFLMFLLPLRIIASTGASQADLPAARQALAVQARAHHHMGHHVRHVANHPMAVTAATVVDGDVVDGDVVDGGVVDGGVVDGGVGDGNKGHLVAAHSGQPHTADHQGSACNFCPSCHFAVLPIRIAIPAGGAGTLPCPSGLPWSFSSVATAPHLKPPIA